MHPDREKTLVTWNPSSEARSAANAAKHVRSENNRPLGGSELGGGVGPGRVKSREKDFHFIFILSRPTLRRSLCSTRLGRTCAKNNRSAFNFAEMIY